MQASLRFHFIKNALEIVQNKNLTVLLKDISR